jgi:hypothetical protein
MNNKTDRDFDIVFGAAPEEGEEDKRTTIQGRVPIHMSDRFRIHDALIGEFSSGEAVPRCAAVLGLCWAGDPLEVPTLRACAYDLIEYGESVYDALYALGLADVAGPAFAARDATVLSIPTEEAIEAAADPIEAQEANSTAST